ncbi:PDZ domain-containing protein [bacterium]|nr:PDZ domain-containing protein [bacterium]
MKKFFKNWFSRRAPKTVTVTRKRRVNEWASKVKSMKFDPEKIRLESVSEHQGKFNWALLILGVLMASAVASRIAALLITPSYTSIPQKPLLVQKPPSASEDLSVIEQRNIFDNENVVPEPFDQGMLDCWSQARPSTQRMNLLGTIVMNDESLSVALVENQATSQKQAVKKDELFFDNKFQALKIDRKRFCFQVKATQEFEYIQIPEEGALASAGLSAGGLGKREGISVTGENRYQIRQSFLDEQLGDLSNVLQTAKAVPAIEGGKMKGFLIQSIDEDSIFASLGLGAGDVLKEVNGITLDNAGKGLEAFTALKGSKKIELTVTRGGQDQTLSYEVK